MCRTPQISDASCRWQAVDRGLRRRRRRGRWRGSERESLRRRRRCRLTWHRHVKPPRINSFGAWPRALQSRGCIGLRSRRVWRRRASRRGQRLVPGTNCERRGVCGHRWRCAGRRRRYDGSDLLTRLGRERPAHLSSRTRRVSKGPWRSVSNSAHAFTQRKGHKVIAYRTAEVVASTNLDLTLQAAWA